MSIVQTSALLPAPSSPRWNDADVNYPNSSQQYDMVSAQEFQEELKETLSEMSKPCCQTFPCKHGRQSLSTRQKKRKLGKVYGKSLCGQAKSLHIVNEKREYMETTEPEEIAEWYYTDTEDEDEIDSETEELAECMELEFDEKGKLQFSEKYLNYIKCIPISSSA